VGNRGRGDESSAGVLLSALYAVYHYNLKNKTHLLLKTILDCELKNMIKLVPSDEFLGFRFKPYSIIFHSIIIIK
jgi:hypothetical protein